MATDMQTYRGIYMPNIEDLQERIIQLEGLLGLHSKNSTAHLMASTKNSSLADTVRLTPSEAKVLDVISKGAKITHAETLWSVLWGMEHNPPGPSNLLNVHVSKIRKKLKPFNIGIETIYGVGWHMTQADRDRLNALIERAK